MTAMLTRLVLVAQASGSPFEFLEKNSTIIYPALALLVLVLLVAGVAHAWKTPELVGAEKAQVKGEVIRLMRSHIGWITATEVGEHLELDPHTAATLLDEMKGDGLLVSAMIDNLIHYRIKGI